MCQHQVGQVIYVLFGKPCGGDLVSLLAYLRGCSQLDAAKEIDYRLVLGFFGDGIDTQAFEKRIQLAQQKVEEKLRRKSEWDAHRQKVASTHAANLWKSSVRANASHPYLVSKGLPPLTLREDKNGNLLIPLGEVGALNSLQIIDRARVSPQAK